MKSDSVKVLFRWSLVRRAESLTVRVVHVPDTNSASHVGWANHWVEAGAGGASLVESDCLGCCVLSCGGAPLPLDGSCWLWSEREWSPVCCVGVLIRCLVSDCCSRTVTSTLAFAGVGAEAVICTSVVPGPAPGRGDMGKLLPLALGVAGVLAGVGVPGGVIACLLVSGIGSCSEARVRSSCNLSG